MIAADAEVRSFWITDEELAAKPNLIKTMSVKPPIGTGRVRLIDIVGYDLQPCGGTHVRNTREIGDVRVDADREEGQAEPTRPHRIHRERQETEHDAPLPLARFHRMARRAPRTSPA